MTYKIIRFRFNGQSKVIKTGLTLEEARAHCQRADTAGAGWFDGYTKDENNARNLCLMKEGEE